MHVYDRTTALRGTSQGRPALFLALAQARDAARRDEVARYLAEVYRLGELTGLNADIAAAQSAHETGFWTSVWWRERLNPAGLGITGDPVQDAVSGSWASGTDAARAQLVHLWLYAAGTELPAALAPFRALDPRWEAAIAAGYAGRCPTLGDLTGTWAVDPDYADKLARHLRVIFANQDADGLPIRQAFIPVGNENRPGLPMIARYITIHETGNPRRGADAEMHRRFTHSGGGPVGVSFHYVVDDHEAIQLLPHDENGWHASDGYDGPGNRTSIGIEKCINEDADEERTNRNLASLVVRLIQGEVPGSLPGDDLDVARISRHYDWAPDKKWCPTRLLNHGWDEWLELVRDELGLPPPVSYAYPSVPPFLADPAVIPPDDQVLHDTRLYRCFRQFTPHRVTPVVRFADRGAPKLRADLEPGEVFTVEYVFRSRSDGDWWGLSRWSSRIPLRDCSPTVMISESTEDERLVAD